jgi:hypothetical protein
VRRGLRRGLAAAPRHRQARGRNFPVGFQDRNDRALDGKPQVTYNGHPLYLYSADQKPGDTNGQGLNAFGGAWFALSAGGNMVSGQGSGSGRGY